MATRFRRLELSARTQLVETIGAVLQRNCNLAILENKGGSFFGKRTNFFEILFEQSFSLDPKEEERGFFEQLLREHMF